MTEILLSGAFGKMGKTVTEYAENNKRLKIVCGVDNGEGIHKYPVYRSFGEVTIKPQVIIDFSHISVLDSLLEFALKNNIAVVLATTGYSNEQIEAIKEASKSIPVFFTANMSLGVNLLSALAKKAVGILGDDFDIEIVEKHHNLKLDAPSGTAIMLANAINDACDDRYRYEYDRHSKRQKRDKNEIGIHSIRGGTIVGEHDVIFAGNDEIVTLSHTATSKGIFATGALKAAEFIATMPAGLYDMSSMLSFE